ncbi:MAG: cell division protein FtsA [Alphaproteobacteria bacterium]|nr:cell division protein FtsA [Alphaproteobacteria bacterium]
MKLRTAGAQPTSYRTGLVAALDVGSSKVVCLIGRAEPGSLRVVGAALRESQGIKSGTVVNVQDAEDSIREAVAAAENHADTRLQTVLVSVSCGAPKSVTARAAMQLDGDLVSDAHITSLLAEARANCRTEDLEMIQSAPVSYVVDEARGVRDPRGMFSQRIGVTMHAVAVKPLPLQNLKLAVQRCHLNVGAALVTPYASGLSCLTADEMQLGATVIDMGGGTTSLAVFLEGQLVHADVVPLGGAHVTSDLARMLSAPLSAAERLKTLYGAALGEIETSTDVVSVPQMGEDGEDYAFRVPRSMLTRIIQPRLEEILIEVQNRLRASGFDVAAGRRAVITGGASQLAATRELAQRVLNKQVRLGRPQTYPGLPAAGAGPDYSTALGLLTAGATMPPEILNPDSAGVQEDIRETGFLRRLVGGIFG